MLILLEIVAKRMETWFESDRPVVARSVKERAMNKSNHLSAASYSKDFISKRMNEWMNEMTREFGNLNLKLLKTKQSCCIYSWRPIKKELVVNHANEGWELRTKKGEDFIVLSRFLNCNCSSDQVGGKRVSERTKFQNAICIQILSETSWGRGRKKVLYCSRKNGGHKWSKS